MNIEPLLSDTKLNIAELLAQLRRVYQPDYKALAAALHLSYSTYLKIERGNRELSFIMALKICKFYQLDLYEFIAMLGDEELERKDLSTDKALKKIDRKKAELLKAKAASIKEVQTEPKL